MSGKMKVEEDRLSYPSCASDERHKVPTHRQQDDDDVEVDWQCRTSSKCQRFLQEEI